MNNKNNIILEIIATTVSCMVLVGVILILFGVSFERNGITIGDNGVSITTDPDLGIIGGSDTL